MAIIPRFCPEMFILSEHCDFNTGGALSTCMQFIIVLCLCVVKLHTCMYIICCVVIRGACT